MGHETENVAELLRKLLSINEGNAMSNQGVANALAVLNEQLTRFEETLRRVSNKVELDNNGTLCLMSRMRGVEGEIEKWKKEKETRDTSKRTIKIYAAGVVIAFVLNGVLGAYAAFLKPTVHPSPAPAVQGPSDSEQRRQEWEQFRRDMKNDLEQWKRDQARRQSRRPVSFNDQNLITRDSPLATLGFGPQFRSGGNEQ